jgi:hypothetical protein
MWWKLWIEQKPVNVLGRDGVERERLSSLQVYERLDDAYGEGSYVERYERRVRWRVQTEDGCLWYDADGETEGEPGEGMSGGIFDVCIEDAGVLEMFVKAFGERAEEDTRAP